MEILSGPFAQRSLRVLLSCVDELEAAMPELEISGGRWSVRLLGRFIAVAVIPGVGWSVEWPGMSTSSADAGTVVGMLRDVGVPQMLSVVMEEIFAASVDGHDLGGLLAEATIPGVMKG